MICVGYILYTVVAAVYADAKQAKKTKNGEGCVSKCAACDGGHLVKIQLVF